MKLKRTRQDEILDAATTLIEREQLTLGHICSDCVCGELRELSRSPQQISDVFHAFAILAALLDEKHDDQGMAALENTTMQFAVAIVCARKSARKTKKAATPQA